MDVDPSTRCPCGAGLPYGECCQQFHLGTAHPPTAERLMRSRYTAYVVENAPYLLATWHASTRPSTVVFDHDLRWLRLDILGRTAGGMLDTEGTVEFRAHYLSDGVRQDQHENSRFVRAGKSWFYVDDIA